MEAGGEQQDPFVFVDEILPLIQPLSTLMLSRATGLSRSYCQDVRAGKYVPHPSTGRRSGLRRPRRSKRRGRRQSEKLQRLQSLLREITGENSSRQSR
jgi:hypothetical protein